MSTFGEGVMLLVGYYVPVLAGRSAQLAMIPGGDDDRQARGGHPRMSDELAVVL